MNKYIEISFNYSEKKDKEQVEKEKSSKHSCDRSGRIGTVRRKVNIECDSASRNLSP